MTSLPTKCVSNWPELPRWDADRCHLLVSSSSGDMRQNLYSSELAKALSMEQTGFLFGSTEDPVFNLRLPSGEKYLPAGQAYWTQRGQTRKVKIATAWEGPITLPDWVGRISAVLAPGRLESSQPINRLGKRCLRGRHGSHHRTCEIGRRCPGHDLEIPAEMPVAELERIIPEVLNWQQCRGIQVEGRAGPGAEGDASLCRRLGRRVPGLRSLTSRVPACRDRVARASGLKPPCTG